MFRRHIPFAVLLWLVGMGVVGCTGNAATTSINSGLDVVTAFRNAGLEATEAHEMQPDDYGTAPQTCDGTRFLLPSLGPRYGGRVYLCEDAAARDALAYFYRDRGERVPAAFSWVYVKNNIVVQINGDMPEETALRYEQAIP